jgi:hypothetical protein
MSIKTWEEDGYVIYYFNEGVTLILAAGKVSEKDTLFASAEERLEDWLSGKFAVMKHELTGE